MITAVCHPLFVPYSFVRQSHILFMVSENDGHIGLWIRNAIICRIHHGGEPRIEGIHDRPHLCPWGLGINLYLKIGCNTQEEC